MPMTPAPIITRRCGRSVSASSWRLVSTFGESRPGIGGRAGLEPVAISVFFVVIFPCGVAIVCASTNEASPRITSMLWDFIRKSTPFTMRATTLSLRAMILAKSNVMPVALTP